MKKITKIMSLILACAMTMTLLAGCADAGAKDAAEP